MRHIFFTSWIATAAALALCSCAHQLPNEPIYIIGGSGGYSSSSTPILDSVVGTKKSTTADDPDIGLMHFVILPPMGFKDVEVGSASDWDSNLISYKWIWDYNTNTIAVPNLPALSTNRFSLALRISYYPKDHAIGIMGQLYRLSAGNFFLIDVQGPGSIVVEQLRRRIFTNLDPPEVIRLFKHDLPNNPRVQGIDD